MNFLDITELWIRQYGVGAIVFVAIVFWGWRKIEQYKATLDLKENELRDINGKLEKALLHASDVECFKQLRSLENLPNLRAELTAKLESIAHVLSAAAASVYIPVFNQRDSDSEIPRGYAFAAVFNSDVKAMKKVRNLKMVETWGIVGDCWEKKCPVFDNELQKNLQHLTSYDSDSGFTAIHTALAPIKFQNTVIGVLQVFNRLSDTNHGLAEQGFSAEDRKKLVDFAEDKSSGIATCLNYFKNDPNAIAFLGIDEELKLDNAVIMYIDLTRSSSIYQEMSLSEVAKLIVRFNDELYRRVQPYEVVLEKFNGDGTLLRFHYRSFKPGDISSNPVYQAVKVAVDMVRSFKIFKARDWKHLDPSIADNVKIRVCLALGKVIVTNVGPRQFPTPTVLGQSVNRAAKMATFATRERDVVMIDDNVRKAMLQIDRNLDDALEEYSGFDEIIGNASLAKHRYYELDVEKTQLMLN